MGYRILKKYIISDHFYIKNKVNKCSVFTVRNKIVVQLKHLDFAGIQSFVYSVC